MIPYVCPKCGKVAARVCTPNATVTCPCPSLGKAVRRTVTLCQAVRAPRA